MNFLHFGFLTPRHSERKSGTSHLKEPQYLTTGRPIGRFQVHLSLHFKVRLWSYENPFSFILKLELITVTKIPHLDSLWKRDWGELELENGLFRTPLLVDPRPLNFLSLTLHNHILGGSASDVLWPLYHEAADGYVSRNGKILRASTVACVCLSHRLSLGT